MKKSIFTALLSVLALGACAESVTPEMAKTAANAWVLRNEHFGAGREAVAVRTVCDTNKAQTVLWHQVSMTGDGCVFVAPVTEIEPIIVALDSDPGELPKAHPLLGILSADIRRRLRFLGLYKEDVAVGARLQSVAPASAAMGERENAAAEWAERERGKWANLGIGSKPRLAAASVGRTSVEIEVCVVKGFEKDGPLTHWDQSGNGGYNLYTPEHAVCGCVATACAAIAQFFGTTNAVTGYSNKCSLNGVPIEKTTMGGAIDWSLFDGCTTRASYNFLSEEQRDVIGRVAYNAGVGVGMMWTTTPQGSGAMEHAITNALIKVFGFKNARYVGIRNAQNPSETSLRKLVYGQCAANAPVGMGIEGHSVVAVGYGQDADGTERVRVFMGWGGTGDGWYALPDIDTKATTGGASYLSQIVDGLVTMISYDNDDIVPVVGQTMPVIEGLAVKFPEVADLVADEETGALKSVSRVAYCTKDGWFATRVPPNVGTFSISCMDKLAEYSVGAKARRSTDETALANSIPDWVLPFALLNSTTRYSLSGAIQAALNENKAILRLSGQSADECTKIVLQHIFELDDANVNDFTNRYVFYFTSASDIDGDQSPSYTVLYPGDVNADYRWYYQNGRLSYGYARLADTGTEVVTTNSVEVGEDGDFDVELDVYEVVSTNYAKNIVVSTYAPTGSTPVYEEIPYWPTSDLVAATNALRTSLLAVMNEGWNSYELRAPGNSLQVVASGGEAGAPEPGWGLHVNCYRTGETVTATATGEFTNEVAGVIMGCNGWTLLNKRTGVELSGEGNSVDIPFASNDSYVLTWQVVTNAVKVTVGMYPDRMARLGAEVTPGSGWYPYGEDVTFTATAPDGYYLSEFSGNGPAALPEDSFQTGASLSFAPTSPISVLARFAQGEATGTETAEYTVATVSYGLMTDSDSADAEPRLVKLSGTGSLPASTIFGGGMSGTKVSDGDSIVLNGRYVTFIPDSETFADDEGGAWRHSFWMLYDGKGSVEDLFYNNIGYIDAGFYSASAGFYPSQNATLVRFYVPDRVEPEEVEIAVKWNDTLDNLKSGENVLLTAEQAAALPKGAQVKVAEDIPAGWKLDSVETRPDGSVVATLSLDEETLAPKPPEGQSSPLTIVANLDGTVTVEATVANGVRGFWYSLYTASSLSGEWKVVAGGEYTSGTPSAQMADENGEVKLSIDVDPSEASRFYKLVVTSSNPSAS